MTSYSEAIVDLFFDLSSWRTAGFNGPNGISLEQLAYYCGFYRAVLPSFEVRMLKMLDDLYISAYYKARA